DECAYGVQLWQNLEKEHGLFAKACNWNCSSKDTLYYAIRNELQPGITRLTNQSLRQTQHVAYGVRFYENGWFEARID
ncbi:hypothetical protein, partial [Oceanidesulfovibrio indonesiensis]|uniref:hypothetical protein n=1 Tax=Oceanidesulfovibrio indonesiensis TaxID=54767 RepID=UPI001AC002DB